MSNKMEIEALEKECLTKSGAPRKNCDLEKLRRLIELKAGDSLIMPEVEQAPDNIKKLRDKYYKLVWRIYEETPAGNIDAVIDGKPMKLRIKPGATAKMMSEFIRLRDMVRQCEPKPERISLNKTVEGNIQIKVDSGPPVTLEGKTEHGRWDVIASIMPLGGRVAVPGDKYKSFRIVRGSDKPQYISPPGGNANPNRKVSKKGKVIDI